MGPEAEAKLLDILVEGGDVGLDDGQADDQRGTGEVRGPLPNVLSVVLERVVHGCFLGVESAVCAQSQPPVISAQR